MFFPELSSQRTFFLLALLFVVSAVLCGVKCSCAAGVVIVEDNSARAVVVLADDPHYISERAADEFVRHVEKATGVTIEIVKESRLGDTAGFSKIYLGSTRAAAAQGIDPDSLEPDAYLLKTVGRDLYVVGKEEPGGFLWPPGRYASGWRMLPSDYRGTLYGVLELLERYLGVRWLWPGELGTYVPRAETLAIGESLDEVVNPFFQARRFRTGGVDRALEEYNPDTELLAFSREALGSYARDLRRYLIRHRMGYSSPTPYAGHFFSGWWDRYGEKHPEWFAMRPDGGRGPSPGADAYNRRHVSMCVSNPGLHRYLAEEVWGGGDFLQLGEADTLGNCRCPDCQAWDEPADYPEFVPYDRIVSDRYARFWAAVREIAAERNPDVIVVPYIYFNYFPAPVSDICLEGVTAEFVPWGPHGRNPYGYFPMREDALEWLKEQWVGWRERGVSLIYRPNYLLGGYVMPWLSTRQSGEMFRFAAERGMLGFDFDSLVGHWAVRGPMLYMHMRLSVNPGLQIDRIREEFFSAFGPAAGTVEEYFDYWEDYAHSNLPFIEYHDPTNAADFYPPGVFQPAKRILDRALSEAEKDPLSEYAERVDFLKAGLEHARLSADFIGKLGHRGTLPWSDEDFLEARTALETLIRFRKEHEHLYIADYLFPAWQENYRIDIKTLLTEDIGGFGALQPGVRMASPWGRWHFRKDPDNLGMEEKWYSTASREGGIRKTDAPERGYEIDQRLWSPVRVPARLYDTDVGAYLGYGWYASVFLLPENFRGSRLNLLFEAVDEQAWVFVNGEYVGEHTVESEGLGVGELWERPFVIGVCSELLKPGEENLLMVRMHASAGASGIWGPVHAYSEE